MSRGPVGSAAHRIVPSAPPERRPWRPWRLQAARLVCALSVGGCASLRPVPPTVDFRGVALKDIALSGATIDVVLMVKNPNAFAIDVRRLAYSLYADSTLVGTGQPLERLQVSAGDSAAVRLPVSFDYRTVGMVIVQLVTMGEVNYRVKGDVTVSTPLGEFNRPFDATGRFNARRGR